MERNRVSFLLFLKLLTIKESGHDKIGVAKRLGGGGVSSAGAPTIDVGSRCASPVVDKRLLFCLVVRRLCVHCLYRLGLSRSLSAAAIESELLRLDPSIDPSGGQFYPLIAVAFGPRPRPPTLSSSSTTSFSFRLISYSRSGFHVTARPLTARSPTQRRRSRQIIMMIITSQSNKNTHRRSCASSTRRRRRRRVVA